MPYVYDNPRAVHEAKTQPIQRRQMREMQARIRRDNLRRPKHARVTTKPNRLRRVARGTDRASLQRRKEAA